MSRARWWPSARASRRCAGVVRVHPGMRVRRQGDGAISVEQLLELGVQWDGIPTYAGHLWVAGSVAAQEFRIFSGAQVAVNAGAELVLGSGYANVHLSLSCFERIEIGRDVIIGEQVMIRDSDNHQARRDSAATAPIRICDEVWIGSRATIMKGVTIGNGSIVAAGAVVVSDVPDHTMVAGVPAVVRRSSIGWRNLF